MDPLSPRERLRHMLADLSTSRSPHGTAEHQIESLASHVQQLRDEVSLGTHRTHHQQQGRTGNYYTQSNHNNSSSLIAQPSSGTPPLSPVQQQRHRADNFMGSMAMGDDTKTLFENLHSMVKSLQLRSGEHDEALGHLSGQLSNVIRRVDGLEERQNAIERTVVKINGRSEENFERLTAQERVLDVLNAGHQNAGRVESITSSKIVEAFDKIEDAAARVAKVERRVGGVEGIVHETARQLEDHITERELLRAKVTHCEEKLESDVGDAHRRVSETRSFVEQQLVASGRDNDRKFGAIEHVLGEAMEKTKQRLAGLGDAIESATKSTETKFQSVLKDNLHSLHKKLSAMIDRVEKDTSRRHDEASAALASVAERLESHAVASQRNMANVASDLESLEAAMKDLNRRLLNTMRVMCEESNGYPTYQNYHQNAQRTPAPAITVTAPPPPSSAAARSHLKESLENAASVQRVRDNVNVSPRRTVSPSTRRLEKGNDNSGDDYLAQLERLTKF